MSQNTHSDDAACRCTKKAVYINENHYKLIDTLYRLHITTGLKLLVYPIYMHASIEVFVIDTDLNLTYPLAAAKTVD